MSMSPFRGRGFYDTHSEVNRLFDEMFGEFGRRSGGRQRTHATEWAPSVDVLQKDGDLVVRAELPGVKPDGVEITVHDRVLTISGERRAEQDDERAGYYVRELRHGSFRRSMTLPEGVEEERIRARYQDGILEVTLEGAAAAREPKRIQIEVSEGQGGTSDVEVSSSQQSASEASQAEEGRQPPPR